MNNDITPPAPCSGGSCSVTNECGQPMTAVPLEEWIRLAQQIGYNEWEATAAFHCMCLNTLGRTSLMGTPTGNRMATLAAELGDTLAASVASRKFNEIYQETTNATNNSSQGEQGQTCEKSEDTCCGQPKNCTEQQTVSA